MREPLQDIFVHGSLPHQGGFKKCGKSITLIER
jgi:hypothetical protein